MKNYNAFPKGPFPPYGHNDNNQNRAFHPSNNISPYNTGNPFENFQPISTNSIANKSDTYAPVYQPPQQTFIDKINYKNPGNLLHNNISDFVLDEQIIEYRVHTDSLDRDILYYNDPFHFKVIFAPSNSAPAPHINNTFRNVKYIKLENIVMPIFNKVIEGGASGEYIMDPSSRITNDRYISLVIKEIEHDRTYATWDANTRTSISGKHYVAPSPFALIFPDKILSTFFTGVPYYGTKVYKNSLLHNIDKLSIDFYDSCGLPITMQGIYTPEELIADPIPITDLRHPLNKKHQLNATFIIGVVEPQINSNTKYEK